MWSLKKTDIVWSFGWRNLICFWGWCLYFWCFLCFRCSSCFLSWFLIFWCLLFRCLFFGCLFFRCLFFRCFLFWCLLICRCSISWSSFLGRLCWLWFLLILDGLLLNICINSSSALFESLIDVSFGHQSETPTKSQIKIQLPYFLKGYFHCSHTCL